MAGPAYISGKLPNRRSHAVGLVPGLALTLLVALAARWMAELPWLRQHAIGGLTLAIVLGIVVGNSIYPVLAASCGGGVDFSKQKLLRLGIVLYGLNLTFQDIGQVGLAGVLIDTLVLCSTFGLAIILGKYVFRLDAQTTLLIGAGSSICGAAAVMATAPVVSARTEQVTVAVATVVVFGTLALFIYPALYQWNVQHALLQMTPHQYGVLAGSTIHEVAQAVAAGSAVGAEAANTAVIAKMVRVMMLAPFLLVLSIWMQRRSARRTLQGLPANHGAGGGAPAIVIPWFAFGFVLVAGVNSVDVMPLWLKSTALNVDSFALAMAMAGLGLTTHISALRRAGLRPLLMGALLFCWLMSGGLLINTLLA